MATKDHPNNVPGVPMRFPVWFERIQIKYMNPVVGKFARYLPGFAIIRHQGRKSGKTYETVVNAFCKGNVFTVTLGHGKTNWVKNVLAAGEADVHLFRRDVRITNPRVLPAGIDDPMLPWIARRAGRQLGVFVADIA